MGQRHRFYAALYRTSPMYIFCGFFSSGGSFQRIMLYWECIRWLGDRRLTEKLKTPSVPFLLLCSLPTAISCFMAFFYARDES